MKVDADRSDIEGRFVWAEEVVLVMSCKVWEGGVHDSYEYNPWEAFNFF